MFRLRPAMRRRIAPRSIGTENLPDLAASHNRQSRVGCRLGVRLWRARHIGSGGAVGGRARAMEMDVALCERDLDPVLLEQLPQPAEDVGLKPADAAFGIGYLNQDFLLDGDAAAGGKVELMLGASSGEWLVGRVWVCGVRRRC